MALCPDHRSRMLGVRPAEVLRVADLRADAGTRRTGVGPATLQDGDRLRGLLGRGPDRRFQWGSGDPEAGVRRRVGNIRELPVRIRRAFSRHARFQSVLTGQFSPEP
jgi:hypothetical protein